MPELKIDNIFARRSIRSFTDQQVSDEQIKTLLEAAMAAPSANNKQPWHFIVVRDQADREALVEAHPYARMSREASAVIIPCGEPALSNNSSYWVQDLAAATENILLAAVGLGLGAVWCGVYSNNERVTAVRKVLSIPEDIMPFCLIPVGYPNEEKEARTQYQESRVHLKKW